MTHGKFGEMQSTFLVGSLSYALFVCMEMKDATCFVCIIQQRRAHTGRRYHPFHVDCEYRRGSSSRVAFSQKNMYETE